MTDASAHAMLQALRSLGRLPPERPLESAGLTLMLRPREEGLLEKGVPVEQLFHKLTMMRDKLRVMEQRINASDVVGLDERRALQAHITVVYEAFTALAAFFSEEALPATSTEEAS